MESAGWSHLAQFTITLVHKDPKLSKYSDTLHRFCKKGEASCEGVGRGSCCLAREVHVDLVWEVYAEHDWGWKRFMDVTKVLEDFPIDGTLTIKAQVQIIRWARKDVVGDVGYPICLSLFPAPPKIRLLTAGVLLPHAPLHMDAVLSTSPGSS